MKVNGSDSYPSLNWGVWWGRRGEAGKKGRERDGKSGGMTGDREGRERKTQREERERGGLYDLAAGSIKKEKHCKRDVQLSLFQCRDGFRSGSSEENFSHRVTLCFSCAPSLWRLVF